MDSAYLDTRKQFIAKYCASNNQLLYENKFKTLKKYHVDEIILKPATYLKKNLFSFVLP
jgi:hypothetical protein